jgi:hypothetical protein
MTLAAVEDWEVAPARIRRVNQIMKERIYFIKCENFVRFTRSAMSEPWLMQNLQPHCPFDMIVIKIVPGGLKLQTELSKTFARYRHNSLWFRYEGDLKAWLEAIK